MKKEDLRIVFMGTPEFAVESLRALVEADYPVVGVVTQPDKPVGRHGSVLRPSPVKQYATEHHLPVAQPEKMKDEDFMETLKQWNPNLQVVVAFRMLPQVVWDFPEYGTFNVHAALLPRYRGAAPINWAIINGEMQTGVTTFFLDKDIDTGRIIMQYSTPIGSEDDVEAVYDRLMKLGAEICLKTVEQVIACDGCPKTIEQDSMAKDDDLQCIAPKLFKENTIIQWTQSQKKVHDFVRGLSPIPGAWTYFTEPDGKQTVLKIYKTRQTEMPVLGDAPGTLMVEKKKLYVATTDGWLELLELQLAGKKRMAAVDFINGMKDKEMCVLRS
ncbi:MAG: methionyl-tRNA formyltransferase [Prevotella sp.]